jgi:hypothetical protein
LTPQSVAAGKIKVSLHEPADSDACGHEVPLRGTVSGLSGNINLWIVKEIGAGNYHPDAGPVRVQGNWWSESPTWGVEMPPVPSPERYTVHVVAASKNTSSQYRAYIERCHLEDCWPGLPSLMGGVAVHTISLTRVRT